MDIETYTYNEFCKHLEDHRLLTNNFIRRCRRLPFKPNFVVVWDFVDGDVYEAIDDWFKKTDFIGWTNKSYACQAEFEKIDDVVYFKLRWS